MQQDDDLKHRVEPPQMDHLAEQIIARTKTIPQERNQGAKILSFPTSLKKPKLSYALAVAACLVLFVSVVAIQNPTTQDAQQETVQVAEQTSDTDWDEFWALEEETMFAGL